MTGLPRIGFIGLGSIGKAMAHRLTTWDGGLTVFDVDPAPVTELADAGARAASSVADLAAECGVVSVMVNTDAQVRDVISEIAPAAKPGTVVAVHSTIAPDLPTQLEEIGRNHDLLVRRRAGQRRRDGRCRRHPGDHGRWHRGSVRGGRANR